MYVVVVNVLHDRFPKPLSQFSYQKKFFFRLQILFLQIALHILSKIDFAFDFDFYAKHSLDVNFMYDKV